MRETSFVDTGAPAPDCSSFQAARRALADMDRSAAELAPYRDEPPQMKSGP